VGRKVLLVALAPVAALIFLMGWALVKSGGQPGGPGINDVFGEVTVRPGPATDFTLQTLNGRQIALSDLRGRVVMVDFWSSWCAPCIAEASTLEATYLAYQAKGVEFVGIAIWDEKSAVLSHVIRYGVTYTNGLDDTGKIAVEYGVRGIPEKFFIDPNGNLVKKFVGPASEQELGGILDGLLAQSSVGG